MHYYVITGGPLVAAAAKVIDDGFIIAADGGIDFCMKHNIMPSLAVGDMDSVSASGLERIKKNDVPIKLYPVEKDMTDTEIAISYVPEGEKVTLVCPLHGRLDHIIANMQLAGLLHSQGRDIVLDDGFTQVWFLSGSEVETFSLERWGNDSAISLVPLLFDRRVTGITTSGLYYALSDDSIEFGKTLSFSNKPIDGAKEFNVSIKAGFLAVVISRTE